MQSLYNNCRESRLEIIFNESNPWVHSFATSSLRGYVIFMLVPRLCSLGECIWKLLKLMIVWNFSAKSQLVTTYFSYVTALIFNCNLWSKWNTIPKDKQTFYSNTDIIYSQKHIFEGSIWIKNLNVELLSFVGHLS